MSADALPRKEMVRRFEDAGFRGSNGRDERGAPHAARRMRAGQPAASTLLCSTLWTPHGPWPTCRDPPTPGSLGLRPHVGTGLSEPCSRRSRRRGLAPARPGKPDPTDYSGSGMPHCDSGRERRVRSRTVPAIKAVGAFPGGAATHGRSRPRRRCTSARSVMPFGSELASPRPRARFTCPWKASLAQRHPRPARPDLSRRPRPMPIRAPMQPRPPRPRAPAPRERGR